MFDVRDKARAKTQASAARADEALAGGPGAQEEMQRRHAVLMELLEDESVLQAEERAQMAIDDDYYDHLQWRPEDAELLMERGQAPLVFNEARQTIDWIIGTEKRMRKDYRVLPREEGDEQGAELKTKLVKYTDDANFTHWHRSRAFAQTAKAGLGWLEEGINPDPEKELIYSGSESWRNVIRDSRSSELDMGDARYLFRRKVTDLDYAIALLPGSREILESNAYTHDGDGHGDGEDDGLWYLGQKLTGASETEWSGAGRFGNRQAYIQRSGCYDNGRRRSVELLECWYRVPESVKVFSSGPLKGQVFDAGDALHVAAADGAPMYATVKMRMRVMICTRQHCLWDGPSPFRHQKFLLIPVWGYRRGRDGQVYGPMRGMRDIQDDLNKRRSKALFALSSNRIVMDEGAHDDVEELREEAARPDGVIVKKPNKEIRFEKQLADFSANMQLANQDAQSMRNAGGVTNENLGRDTPAQSGIAIERKQDQGSLTTSELFDNLMLAIKLAGEIRLSHIEQYYTEAKAIRIVGENQPLQWIKINQQDPLNPANVLNDITAARADFIVDTQSWRASLAHAAMDQMFELLGKIATFAPQVVLSVLDLLVDSADIKNKEEWVTRIRKLNGQRDPARQPTPEEMQAEQASQQKQAAIEELNLRTAQAKVAESEAKVKAMDVEDVLKRVEAMFSALRAAQVLATTPGAALAADEIVASAGLKDLKPGGFVVPQAVTEAVDGADVGAPVPTQAADPERPGALPQAPDGDGLAGA